LPEPRRTAVRKPGPTDVVVGHNIRILRLEERAMSARMARPSGVIDEYELFAPSGRKYVFRRRTLGERIRSALKLALLIVLSLALHILYLSPIWRLFIGW
jgi:hypothetical protein